MTKSWTQEREHKGALWSSRGAWPTLDTALDCVHIPGESSGAELLQGCAAEHDGSTEDFN